MSNPTSPNLYAGAAPGESGAKVAVKWTPGGQTALLKKSTYAMMGAAGLLLLGAGAGFFLISGKIQAAQVVESAKQSQVGTESQVAKKYDDTLADYNATESQLKYLEKPGPANLYVATLVPQVQKLAQDYGCSVKSLVPGAVTNANGSPAGSPASTGSSSGSGSDASAAAPPAYQTMTLTMSLSGTYSQVMSFIYHLTRFPKMLTVKSLNLTPGVSEMGGPQGGATSGPQQVSAQMTLMAYIFNADDDSGAASSADQTAANPPKLGSITATRAAEDEVMQPVGAANAVQQESAERVQSAGLQAQPTPPTLPTNLALRK